MHAQSYAKIPQVYFEPSRTSTMKVFVKVVNAFSKFCQFHIGQCSVKIKKKKMCKYCKNIKGTNSGKHKEINESKWTSFKKSIASSIDLKIWNEKRLLNYQIPGSLGHEKCLNQISEYSKKKRSSFSWSADQKLFWLKDLINEGSFYVCVICQRCLHKIKSVFCYDERKFENKLQTSNFNLVRSSDGNLCNCTTFLVKNQKYTIPCLADESKLKAFGFH